MKKNTGKKLLGILLTLTMIVGLMPGMSLTAFAGDSITVTWSGNDIPANLYTDATANFSKDNVTLSGARFLQGNVIEGGTFTTTRGNFTKIRVTVQDDTCGNTAFGTTYQAVTKEWTGNDSSVSIGGYIEKMSSITFTIEPAATNYPLWVGGTQVTSENASDIPATNGTKSGTASYDAETRTLTLNGYSYTGVGYKMGSTDQACAAICWSDMDNPLTIQLSGTNSIVRTGKSDSRYGDSAYYGIYSPGDIIIKGPATASLSVDGGDTESQDRKNSYGISAETTIQDVQVTASGTSTGISILSAIQRANVTATGGSYGISSYTLEISENSTVTATGGISAIDCSGPSECVKNAIPGTGWTNTEGTEGKTTIAVSSEGQDISSYKKVQFPEVKDTAVITKAPQAKTLTYTGSAQELVTAGEATGGEMQYCAYTIGADTKPALLVDWSDAIPTATEAGRYKVCYKAVGDAYHVDSDTAYVEVTISEVPVYDYDEPVAYKVNLPASVPGGTVTVSRSSAASGSTVTVTPVADDGFRVGEVTVTDAAGKAVTVRDNGDGTWSFTMPASDVTVGVTFPEILATGYSGCDHGAGCLLNGFTDLDPNAWYHDGVHFCLENGFMIGMGDGRFDPDGATTRAMIVTVLYRVEGKPAVTGGSPFGDVATGAWYTDAVIWAAANGIVNGYEDGTFHPDDAITREQLAAILYRYAQSKGQGFQGLWSFPLDFPDAGEVSEWADEAMHWMVMNGVVGGKDGRLLPGGNASRAETATMLQRFYEIIEK